MFLYTYVYICANPRSTALEAAIVSAQGFSEILEVLITQLRWLNHRIRPVQGPHKVTENSTSLNISYFRRTQHALRLKFNISKNTRFIFGTIFDNCSLTLGVNSMKIQSGIDYQGPGVLGQIKVYTFLWACQLDWDLFREVAPFAFE